MVLVAGGELLVRGAGGLAPDFAWASPAVQTPGAANNDQVLVASGDPLPPTADCDTTASRWRGRPPPPTRETANATLTVAGTTAVGTYPVKITATSDDGAQAGCTVTVTVSAPLETSLISAVQGDGATSSMVGQDVQVEAVVTSLITRRDVLDGFFVQEEDTDSDSDPDPSEGVYVFCRSTCPTGLAAG